MAVSVKVVGGAVLVAIASYGVYRAIKADDKEPHSDTDNRNGHHAAIDKKVLVK